MSSRSRSPFRPRIAEQLEARALLAAQVIDDGDAGFLASGHWTHYEGHFYGPQGLDEDITYSPPSRGLDAAFWTFEGLTPGVPYRVATTWFPHENRATDAPYEVLDGPGVMDPVLGGVRLNQEQAPDSFQADGAGWEEIGVFTPTTSTLMVRLTDFADEYVIADAVRIEPISADPGGEDPGGEDPGGEGPGGEDPGGEDPGGEEPPPPPPPPDPVPLRTVRVTDRAELNAAIPTLTPGTTVILVHNNYGADLPLINVQGTADAPIVFASEDPANKAVFGGGGEGIHVVDGAYLVFRNIGVQDVTQNGFNIDDGGTYATPSHHITLDGVEVKRIGTGGNEDGIKLSGADDIVIRNGLISDWGGGGSAFDLVGSHRVLIENNVVQDHDFGAHGGTSVKGGSSDVTVRGNTFYHAGERGVMIGGSDVGPFARPEGATWTVNNMVVEHNVFVGGQSAVAFASNGTGAVVRFNTIYHPTTWAIRMLTESPSNPTQGGEFHHNIIVHNKPGGWNAVDVSAGSRPETFSFHDNYWFNNEDPSASAPVLPVADPGAVYGQDPQFVDIAFTETFRGDFRLRPGSPAEGYGAFPEG